MKNVTVTLPEELATRARVAAARENKSLSRYIADLLAERCGRRPAVPSREEALKALEALWRGPGLPGVSEDWKGRDELYAERDDKLLRGYQHSGLQRRSGGGGKAAGSSGLAETPRKFRRARSKPAKPE
ncbi:hypothetical protein [Pseudorhodoplanes sp.]|uniref:hypothetical protein n=1 Tax=Pseudorhodoplanes sp. TaxID=1934341 RepID=UPI00391CC6B4